MKTTFLTTLLLLCIGIVDANATMDEYKFTAGTGTANDMSGYTEALPASRDDYTAGSYNIGFTFNFDGTDYSTFSISSNGWMKLGSHTTNSDLSNAFDGGAQYPVISAFWDDLETYVNDGYVRYVSTGTAPNRVLTVEWRTMYWTNVGGPWVYQVRLYESTNAIEFYYVNMPGGGVSATIGAATSSSNFASITPGNPATISYTSANNSIDVDNTPIANGTLYTLVKCETQISITGNTSQGGTTKMAADDDILVDLQAVRGESVDRQPFSINLGFNSGACEPRDFRYTLGGAFPGDYRLSTGGGTLNNLETNTPTVTFTPGGIGLRSATLNVSDDNGFSRTYTLNGEGIPRIAWIGNTSQGGTTPLDDGDILMRSIEVRRLTSGQFTPITIRNNGTSLTAPPAKVTYTLIDASGQYSIAPTSANLGAGEVSTPDITFAPTGAGEQQARLRVNADGEIREFLLAAYSLAPSAEFSLDGNNVTSGSGLFNREVQCVGSSVSVPVTITNTNRIDLEVDGVELYQTESMIRQGVPRYPILRDAFGNRKRSVDYTLTQTPGGTASPQLPIVVGGGETRTFYLNYTPTYPGSRFARIFVRTNAENFSGADIGSFDPGATPSSVEGLFSADLFGKALGADLAGANRSDVPSSVIFEATEVRETMTASTWVENNGECDLLISRKDLQIVSGDIAEFSIVSAMANTSVVGDNYVLPPGAGDSIVVAFTPQTFGSRRASVRMVTNDSTIILPGVTERGSFYLDLFGVGKVGLEARTLRLDPAVIGAESSSGSLMVANTSGGEVTILDIALVGSNGDITEDGTNMWPTTPLVLLPGDKIGLGLTLSVPDAAAAPGDREAMIRLVLRNGDTIFANVSGYAGTRTLSATPGAAFSSTMIPVGEIARTFVVVSNTGTLPVRLDDPMIVGTDSAAYTVSDVQRRVLGPGEISIFEVTYAPQVAGSSIAQLLFNSNATNGQLVIDLGGEGTGTERIDDPSGSSSRQSISGNGTNAVTGSNATSSLTSITPNPAVGTTSLQLTIADGSTSAIGIYDASGRLVRTISDGDLPVGSHALQIDLSGLSSGTYYCVLRQGDHLSSRTLTVVR